MSFVDSQMKRYGKGHLVWLQGRDRRKEREANLLSHGIIHYSGFAGLSGSQPIVSSYGKSSITWLGIAAIKHRNLSASTLFRQIRRRLDRIACKHAA